MDSENQTTTVTNNEERRPRRKLPWIIGGLVLLGLLGLTVVAIVLVVVLGSGAGGVSSSPAVYDQEYVSGSGSDRIVVVPVEGTITSANTAISGAQPTTTPEGLQDALDQAKDDDSVVAVVLAVNSPGGGVTASDEMHQAILDFKKQTDMPVVVSMGDVAASGGYYISTAADEIVANQTTLTGSLGVVLPLLNFSKAADKYGVTQKYIKSGKFKTMGSQWKDLTDDERKIFDSIVQDNYDRFVQVIVDGRKLSETKVRKIADGRVYSGEQAKELGLVDSFGGLDEAAKESRKLAKVDQATVIRYVQTPSLTDTFLSRLAPPEPEAQQVMDKAGLNLEAKPYYIYLPGS